MIKKDKLIAVVCYNSIEFWESRERALKFYKEAARYCDGCESERYANIVWDLMDSKLLCEDGSSCTYEYLKDKNAYHTFNNGTNIRDYNGVVDFPTDTYGLCMELPPLWQ